MGNSPDKERPLDYFLRSVKQAEKGITPQWTMRECLERTNLTKPYPDDWTLLERMVGRYIDGGREFLSEEMGALWQVLSFGRFEKRVERRQSNQAEEELAKLMVGVLLVHEMRERSLCSLGQEKLASMVRGRPDLILGALEDIKNSGSNFPSVMSIETRKRQVSSGIVRSRPVFTIDFG